ncbi:MAG: hypothetical protein Q7S84_04710 [bacterium]|nr:hypothetical protein [bacterium]
MDDGRVPKYSSVQLSLRTLNVLAQPRKTFTDIEELRDDTAQKGQIEPPVVVCFTKEFCVRYLGLLNHLWRTSFKLGDMVPSHAHYYILLAGERRYRALSLLWHKGCSSCQEDAMKRRRRLAAGHCFRKHFGRKVDTIEVRLSQNMAPLLAVFLQLSENTHVRVPPHEEARAYTELFRLIRYGQPNFPLAIFARNVGRSPETVRNAIRFCDLPIKIQELVEKGFLSYGLAIELTRLSVARVRREQFGYWVQRALTTKSTVAEFRKSVAAYLAERVNGTSDLFGIMSREAEGVAHRAHIKQTVAKETIRALWGWVYYFRRVRQLFDEGLLGMADSPFSLRSPVRVHRDLLVEMERLIPHLRKVLHRYNHTDASKILGEAGSLAKQMEAIVPEDPKVPMMV